MNKTEHLGLNQWALEDPIKMEDFNRDNALLDAALAGKLGRSEIIRTYPSDGEFTSTAFKPPIDDWNEWEYVCALYRFPGKTAKDPETVRSALSDWDFNPDVFTPIAMPGFMIVFLPRHNAEANVNGFYIADHFMPFSLNFPFRLLRAVSTVVTEESGVASLVMPEITYFGGR